ncbi:MAG: Peptidase S16 [uncultured Thiotrichaceae bacterium]|uniref:Peptidase S16 n=1 Tax=uncultured Thiotrichaceae bacterium TaxID=298394 RepID=A0A6S6U1K8_9GAMM|nr:MAG: Peptidase S16 [uncultured Thiotrichaceae bacterium]
MKPNYPLTQSFDELPEQLPLYPMDNALLPDGEFPLELSSSSDLALFISALRADQLIGIVQPKPRNTDGTIYQVGCAGRLRQYRERKDGRLNVMLTGICRFRIIEQQQHKDGYTTAKVDWSDYKIDYSSEDVDSIIINRFKKTLRDYFVRHNMQADWKVLNRQKTERMVNNLVLIINLDIDSKQKLLEAPTLTKRVILFTELLANKADPILASAPGSKQ